MKKTLYNNILDLMVTKGYISKENEDLYLYAMKISVQGVINMFALFVIGLLLGMLKESIFMFLSFFVLRKFSGGLHADKYITCLISSLFISIVGLILIKNYWFVSINTFVVIMLILNFLIIVLSPIEHPNKQILDKERKIYKLIATVLSVTISSISFLLVFNESYIEVGYSLSTGLMTSSLLMIVGKFKLSKN